MFNKYSGKYENGEIELSIQKADLYKNRVVPIIMIIIGIGMAGIWSADIMSGKFSAQGFFFNGKKERV